TGGATTGATGGLAFFDSIVGSSATTNRLIGPNATTKWKLTGSNVGTVGSVAYSGFANLQGGTGADTFTLVNPGAGVSGTIDGGAGSDLLVALNATNTWTLTGMNAGTLNGQAFAGMENLTGGTGNDNFIFINSGSGVTGTITGNGGS